MKVVICEDDSLQNQALFTEINNYAMFHEPSIEVVLCAKKPDEVLKYLKQHKADCYILDIELNDDMDGMELAMEIRKNDPLSTIIFKTTHADRLKLTFTYKLAALDFIVKDTREQISSQLRDALQAAFSKYKQIGQSEQAAMIQIQIGERIKNIAIDDVFYIETSSTPHKLTLYEKKGIYEFYGKLSEYEQLDASFYRCHKSYLINLQHVIEFDKKERFVQMTNGAVCEVSFRGMKDLKKKISLVY